jgi:hypothetical protein
VGWWKGDGNTLDSIRRNDGSAVGNLAYEKGEVGTGFLFDGTSSLADRSFTIDAWINFISVGSRLPIVAHDDGPHNQRKWIFWYDAIGDNAPPGPALRFHLNGPDLGPQDPIWTPWYPNPGTWYHVAVTRQLLGNNVKLTSTYSLYINGQQIISQNSPYVLEDAASTPLTIGQAEGLYTNAIIDEVDIFDRALAPSEIASIYNAGNAGKCVPAPSVVGASLPGFIPDGGKVTCTDTTTGQSVSISLPNGPRSYNCLAAGLSVSPGDKISVDATSAGVAQ